MTGATIDFDTYVPALVNALERSLSTSSSALYRERFGLGVVEWRILAVLAKEDGLSAQRVSEIVGLDKAPVSRALAELADKRLATIAKAEKGRRHRLGITPAGRALYRTSLAVARERENVLLQDFSVAERLVLRKFLHRLIARTPDLASLPSAAKRPPQSAGSRRRAR
jgi:DNA-binding MarR family transcriptional regulator